MDHQQWLQSMVQADQAMQQALETFYLAVDKEVATAAAYKAIGLDPRDAPKFGWGLLGRAPNTQVVQNVSTEKHLSGMMGASTERWWLGLIGGLLAGVLLLGIGWSALGHWFSPAPAAPAVKPVLYQVILEYQGKDGKWLPVGEPVRVPTPP